MARVTQQLLIYLCVGPRVAFCQYVSFMLGRELHKSETWCLCRDVVQRETFLLFAAHHRRKTHFFKMVLQALCRWIVHAYIARTVVAEPGINRLHVKVSHPVAVPWGMIDNPRSALRCAAPRNNPRNTRSNQDQRWTPQDHTSDR